METTTTNQVKVGVFILLGLSALIVSIFIFGGNQSVFTSQVRMRAHFDQVQGLSKGSVISLAGITIGNIEEITFAEDAKKLEIRFKFDAAFHGRIREGSTIDIRTQGALGDKYLYIEPGPAEKPQLSENSVIASVPQTDLLQIVNDRSKDVDKIFDIMNELAIFSKTLNKDGRTERILANLVSVTDNLNGTLTETRAVMNDIRGDGNKNNKLKGSMDRLSSIMEKLDKGEGTLGALINDPSLHEQLRTFLGGSQRSKSMKSIIRGSIEKNEETGN
ncbi:MAG: MlaD family protein [Pseudobdellovibrionaceae bacterium]